MSWKAVCSVTLPLFLVSCFLSACTKSADAPPASSSKKITAGFNLIFPHGYSYDKSSGSLILPSGSAPRKAQAAPAYLTGAEVTITGEGTPPLTLKVDVANATASFSVQPGVYTFNVAVFTNIGLTFSGKVTVALHSGDNGTLVITMGVNAPPATISASASNLYPIIGDTVTLSCSATDPDGDPMTFNWTGPGFSAGGPVVSYTTATADPITLTCSVSDGLGGVLSASVTLFPHAPCLEPNLDCGSGCVNPIIDGKNCGACGNDCGGWAKCMGGGCVPITPACPAPTLSCGGICVDTQVDVKNCGACGFACAKSEVCSGGKCVLVCTAPLTQCGAVCSDLQTDVMNCGICGNNCHLSLTSSVCITGVCQCPISLPPASWWLNCGGACVDSQTDVNNCGSCGAACTIPGQICNLGVCACPAGKTLCSVMGCFDLLTDPNNCGTCFNVCPPTAPNLGLCIAGAC